jgi:hypothetical protein
MKDARFPEHRLKVRDMSTQEDFRMLVLGDSVLSGVGLRNENKIHSKIVRWLETEVFKESRRAVKALVLAHSGARIQPAFDRKKRLLPAAGSPEIASSNPSILSQIDLAAEACTRQGASPDKIELIIVNGGANDLQIHNLLVMVVPNRRIISKAGKVCYESMLVALEKMAGTFPNALIMIPGYYQLISKETQAVELPKSLFGLVGLRKLGTIVHTLFFRIHSVRDVLANRSVVWKEHSDLELEAAVNQLNRTHPFKNQSGQTERPRAVFVPSPFKPENSYAAPETHLWQLVGWGHSNDETRLEREQLCKLDRRKGFGYSLCKKGAFGHPNVHGAHAYFEAIKCKLAPMIEPSGWLEKSVNAAKRGITQKTRKIKALNAETAEKAKCSLPLCSLH